MNTKSLPEFIRTIQQLNSPKNDNEAEDYDFYKAVLQVIQDAITPGNIETLVPINLGICSLERANKIAKSYGLHVVEGGSGTMYLSWSKGLDKLND